MALNEGPTGYHTVPQLNYQNWENFHSFAKGTDLFPIDVLLTSQRDFEIFTGNRTHSLIETAELPERIRINSHCVIDILRKVCGPSHFNHGPVTMFRPYKTLVFFDQDIRDSVTEIDKQAEKRPIEGSPDTSTSDSGEEHHLAQLGCLIQFMDTHLSSRIAYLQSPEHNTIFFSDLWLLYRPGDFVISRDLRQAYKVIRVESERKATERNRKLIIQDESISIHCVCIDFDGRWLGPVLRKITINTWAMSRNIGFLELIPLTRATAQKDVMRQDLIRRGQTFVQVANVSPMHYRGLTLDTKIEVNNTIMVDFEEALSDEDDFKAWRTTIEHHLAEARMFSAGFDAYDDEADGDSSKDENTHEDSYVDRVRHQRLMCDQFTVSESGDQTPSIIICPRLVGQVGTLTEEELLIMNYRVFGFILDAARWGE